MTALTWYAMAADLAAITLLGYVVYFRRHGRRDLVLGYVAVNVGVFTVVTLLVNQPVQLAIGFGLFGVLSIIRLRSSAISQEEVGYYFVALALGLVNGLSAARPAMLAALNVLLLVVMYVADHPRVLPRARRRTVVLDVVHHDPGALVADLRTRLGGEVRSYEVTQVDFVRDTMTLDVRFREPRAGDVRRRAGDGVLRERV